jgi:hypothetical protein
MEGSSYRKRLGDLQNLRRLTWDRLRGSYLQRPAPGSLKPVNLSPQPDNFRHAGMLIDRDLEAGIGQPVQD